MNTLTTLAIADHYVNMAQQNSLYISEYENIVFEILNTPETIELWLDVYKPKFRQIFLASI